MPYKHSKEKQRYTDKDWFSRMITLMSPAGATYLLLSTTNNWGVGAKLMTERMRQKNVSSLEGPNKTSAGSRDCPCEMTKELMNIHDEELISGLESGALEQW